MRLPRLLVLLAVLTIVLAMAVSAETDIISKASSHSSSMTLDRLEAALKERGFMIFTRIDHAAPLWV